jgi:hypothetical protein
MVPVRYREMAELIYLLTQHHIPEERKPNPKLLLAHHVEWCHVVLSTHQEKTLGNKTTPNNKNDIRVTIKCFLITYFVKIRINLW